MTRHSPLTSTDHLTKIITSRCEDFGIELKFDPYASTAYTNGKRITIPAIKQPVSSEALDTLYGYIIHECGHHVRPEAFDILRIAKPPEHLCALFNIVEDDSMERERAYEWKGDKVALSRMNELLMKKAVDEINEGGTLEGDINPSIALLLNQYSRTIWDQGAEHYVKQIIKSLPQEGHTLLSELIDEGWVEKFRSSDTSKAAWNTAVDLAKRMYPDNDQQEYEQIREAGNKAADGNNEGQRDDSASSFKDAQSNRLSNQKETEDDNSTDGNTISWKDAVLSEHNEWEAQDGKPGSVGITWEDYQEGGQVALMPTHMVNVYDMDQSKANVSGTGEWYHQPWQRFMPTEAHSRAFANRIRRYIQSQARSIVDREKYHGKIDKQAITRLVMPPIDGGDWNKRIFYDQRKHTMKDTAIFVLVDWSGSMMGDKMHYAADAAQRLVWCFDRVLNVPVALAAFSDGRSKCDIGYIKKWNTRGKSAEDIAKNFAKFQFYTSANNDSDSVHWAYNELKKRRESRKILIVLSDGAPAGSFQGGWGHDALLHATKIIEKDKEVEMYGVGIQDEAVKNYYTNWSVVNDSSQINEVLFNLIKEGNNV